MLFFKHLWRYGNLRITKALRYDSIIVNEKSITDRCGKNWCTKASKCFKATTNNCHNLLVAPSLLEQYTSISNEKWASDIAYIWINEGYGTLWRRQAILLKYLPKLLNKHSLRCSMSKTGDCYDNVILESWNHSFKVEQFTAKYSKPVTKLRRIYLNILTLLQSVRLHSGLGYLIPEKFEGKIP